MTKKKICITGGHLTPAVSLIEEITNRKYPWEIIFVGRKKALERDKHTSEEYRIIKKHNILFVSLTTGRLRRFASLDTFLSVLKVPVGLFQSFLICTKHKPDLIVSFGGYVGLPILIAGYFLRIPTVIHEQTDTPGLANRIASIFAKKIFISSKSTQITHPKKTVYTGLPIRYAIFSPPDKSQLKIPLDRKIIYVLGGATGSLFINELMYKTISRLTKKYTVVHQVGRNWINTAGAKRLSLRGDRRKHYFIFSYIDDLDHSWLLSHAGLVISRSGANTIFEIAIREVISVLIPLKVSAYGEQLTNASKLSKAHTAIVLSQSKVTPEILLAAIEEIFSNIEMYKRNAKLYASKLDTNGSKNLVYEIKKILQPDLINSRKR
ncbi:glycosyltransferase [Patescibacteria group bacterium]